LKQVTSKAITAEVYTSFVDTFFSDMRSLVTGAFIQVVVVGAAWLHSHNLVYLLLIGAILATALFRVRQLKAYHADKARVTHNDIESRVDWAMAWESRYIWLTALATLLIGLYSFIALQVAPNEYSIVSSTILVFGTLPTVVGRAYVSDRLASVIVFSLLLPMAAGLLLRADISHALVAMLCVAVHVPSEIARS
jgi:hypothetical protein